MSTVEQPPKKRKLYETQQPSPPPPPPSQPPPPPPPPPYDDSIPPPPQTPPPLSPDEILRRRRNQEEIRNVYQNCKTIKRCISSYKDPRHLPDVEQAYLSLISASRGGTSIQRILSEFIPHYASYCPTALEAAAQVIINMHNWNLPLISRQEDVDGVSFETATNCIAGLVDICCTASREAPSSSVIQGICSMVFLNAARFFASSVEGKGIFEIIDSESLNMQDSALVFARLKHQLLEENVSPIVKLLKFRALCLLWIFFLCPKDVLSACFELFSNHTMDGLCREGLYFIDLLCGTLSRDNCSEVCEEARGPDASTIQMKVNSESSFLDHGSPNSDYDRSHTRNEGLLKCCLLGLVLRRDLSLKKWIFYRYRRLLKSTSREAFSQVTNAFSGVFESFTEQVQDAGDDEKEGSYSTIYVSAQSWEHGISNQHRMLYETPANSYSSQLHEQSLKDDVANRVSGQHLKRHSSTVSVESDRNSNTSSNQECGGSRCLEFDTKDDGVRGQGRMCMHKDHLTDRLLTPVVGKQGQMTDILERDKAGQLDKNQSSDINATRFCSSVVDNPVHGNDSTISYSSASSQIVWYSDGDPAAMNVFSASRMLWLGYLTPDTSEAAVRFELEKFGPIENFLFFHVKGFALVEFRSIVDAIKAREFLPRYTPWGNPVRVKFIDVGLGTKGAVNGVAIGSSSLVFVGNVLNQRVKDEIMRETMKALYRGPRQVTEFSSEGALLIEFDAPADAANAMACIRQFRRGNNSFSTAIAAPADMSNFWNSAPAPAGGVLGNTCTTFLGSPHGQTAGSPSNRIHITYVPFKMKPESTPPDFASPKACFEQGMTFASSSGSFEQAINMQSEPSAHSNMVASICRDPPGSMAGTSGQVWSHQKQCFDSQPAGEFLEGTFIASEVSTIAPLPIQVPSYMPHIYPPPSSSWDGHGFSHHIPVNSFSPSPMSSSVHCNLAPPFVQASVTPFSQITGSGIQPYNHMLLHHVPSATQPQPDLPLPLPPPPTAPPPPISPPPPLPAPAMDPSPSITESSTFLSAIAGMQVQWQGSLSKSGIHFCTIYASRVDTDLCKYSNSLSEPAGWPAKLDMTKRTDFRHVKATFTNTPPHKREVCQLVPSSAADRKGFQDFIAYLTQRDCAGVIKIACMKSLWARLLFILPYTPGACSMLSVKPNTTDCLIGLVLPKDANTDCT